MKLRIAKVFLSFSTTWNWNWFFSFFLVFYFVLILTHFQSLTHSYRFLQFLKCDHEQNGWIEMGIVKNEWEIYSKSEVIKISVLCSSSGATNTHTLNSWNNETRFIRFRWLAAFSRRQTMLYLYQIASEAELVNSMIQQQHTLQPEKWEEFLESQNLLLYSIWRTGIRSAIHTFSVAVCAEMSYKNTKQSARRGKEKNSVCFFRCYEEESMVERALESSMTSSENFHPFKRICWIFITLFSKQHFSATTFIKLFTTNCATFLLHLCIFQIKAEIFTLNRTATRNDFDTNSQDKEKKLWNFPCSKRRENCKLRKSLFSKSTLNPNSACDNWKRRKNFTFNFSFGASRQYFSE